MNEKRTNPKQSQVTFDLHLEALKLIVITTDNEKLSIAKRLELIGQVAKDAVESKVCAMCGTPKKLADFPQDVRRKDGHGGKCKECRLLYDARWRAANREKLRAKARAYGKTEHGRASNRQRQSRHKKKNRKKIAGMIDEILFAGPS